METEPRIKFRKHRRARGKSAKEIGLQVRASQSEVSRFERGLLKRGAKVNRMLALLERWDSEAVSISDEAEVDTKREIDETLIDKLESAARLFRRRDPALTAIKAQTLGDLHATIVAIIEAGGIDPKTLHDVRR